MRMRQRTRDRLRRREEATETGPAQETAGIAALPTSDFAPTPEQGRPDEGDGALNQLPSSGDADFSNP